MKNRTNAVPPFVVAAAAIALSVIASIDSPAAQAKPREVNCVAIDEFMADSYQKGIDAYAAGDNAAGDSYMRTFAGSSKTYQRYCLG